MTMAGAGTWDTAWDSLFSNRVDTSVINLTIGAPGPSILNCLPKLFQDASSNLLSKDSVASIFQYGPEVGTEKFRRELASFLSRNYKDQISMNELVLTSGATNGLHLSTLAKHPITRTALY